MIDNLIAFRIIYKLVTPFKDTKAFKLGIIDEMGVLLKKPKTSEELDSYDLLNRLVFNLKRLLIKLPGGDSKLKNIVSAYFLIKENFDNDDISDHVLEEQLTKLSNDKVFLVEEMLEVMSFISVFEDVGSPSADGGTTPVSHIANITGKLVSTDEPVIKKRKKLIMKFSKAQIGDL